MTTVEFTDSKKVRVPVNPAVGNTIEEIEKTQALIYEKQQELAKMLEESEVLKQKLRRQGESLNQVADVISEKLGDLIDKDKFFTFFSRPYTTYEIPKTNEVLVFVPKFAKNFKGVGTLQRENDEFFVYKINRYSVWLGEMPEDLKQMVNFKPEVEGYIEGDTLHFEPSQKDAVKKRLKEHIDVESIGDNQVRIKRYHTFDLIADMIDAGCLPFKPRPIAKDDLKRYLNFQDWCKEKGLDWRPYQQEYVDTMMRYGAEGVFSPTGSGKSMVALYFLDVLKGIKRIFYPMKILSEQWAYYIEKYIPESSKEIQLRTLHSVTDADMKEEAMFTIFDECQRLPANILSRAAMVPTRYRMGLSASPHREDGRESYIFALTGVPKGTNWNEYMKYMKRKYHEVNVHVVKNDYAKVIKVRGLIDFDKKTLIFSDSLELGQRVATDLSKIRGYDIPFINGQTKDGRLDMIKNNQTTVISRVGDLGISIPNLERIIEVDFLFGSKAQELQRTGRLMHSQVDGKLKHDILMTPEEYDKYGKRLWSFREKGFNIKVHED